MKLLHIAKDGGPQSNVTGYWLVEIKSLFSIVLLVFSKGSREASHSHAFNSISWVFKGNLREETIDGEIVYLSPSIKPIFTSRDRFHKVFGLADKTYVISFRGPWVKYWKEHFSKTNEIVKLTHGRIIVDRNLTK